MTIVKVTPSAVAGVAVTRAGPRGKGWVFGAGAPSDTVGFDGEFYLDSETFTAYGPKANGTWVGAPSVDLTGQADIALAAQEAAEAAAALTALDAQTTSSDRAATTADRLQTGQDRAATIQNLIVTNENVDLTHADAVATAADRVATGEDRAATAADRVSTNADAVSTASDAATTAADREQTGLDAAATASDRVATGEDRAATAADRVQTGLDAAAAAASAIEAQTATSGKMDIAVYDANGDGVVDAAATVPWDGTSEGRPLTFPPDAHNHDDRYYTETETDDLLEEKLDASQVSSFALSILDDASAAEVRTTIGAQATMSKAVAADVRLGTDDAKYLTAKSIFDASAVVASSGSGAWTPDFAAGLNFQRTLTGTSSFNVPTGMKEGQSGVIYFIQDGTGSRTLSISTSIKIAGGTLTLSTLPNTVDRVGYFVRNVGGTLRLELTAIERGIA